MRAPFQILAIPYRITNEKFLYCVFHRSDHDQWQFVAGGGENNETPEQAAKREIFEESGVVAENVTPLTTMCYVTADCFSEKARANWSRDTYVIPEYSFAFECSDNVVISREHTEYAWLTYEETIARLKWDSNKTALYELDNRLIDKNLNNKGDKLCQL